VWLATAGGLGFAPLAPGTVGAAAGVGLFFALAAVGAVAYALATLAVTLVGVWAAGRAEEAFGRKDDGRVVIDEVAGQLLALAPLVPAVRSSAGLGSLPFGDRWFLALVVTGFVAFRVFDIWKPGPVRWAEWRFKGGVGVMADDLVAGALGALVLGALLLATGGLAAPEAAS
jgi:phosphatidylglycerophosphatase A